MVLPSSELLVSVILTGLPVALVMAIAMALQIGPPIKPVSCEGSSASLNVSA